MMVKHCADARFVWNLGLEQRNLWRRGMKSISVYDQKRSLTEARNTTDWLGERSSVIQQQTLFDLDRAFRNWWKNPSHFRRPTWRKVGLNEGFNVRDLSVRRMKHPGVRSRSQKLVEYAFASRVNGATLRPRARRG